MAVPHELGDDRRAAVRAALLDKVPHASCELSGDELLLSADRGDTVDTAVLLAEATVANQARGGGARGRAC